MSAAPRLPSPPVSYSQRDQAETRRSIEAALANAQSVLGAADAVTLPIAQSDVTGLETALAGKQASLVRGTVTVTTASLADGATETGTVVLGKTGLVLEVTADRACWVRLYGTSAERTADASRDVADDPTNDAPVLAEFVFDASGLTIPCAPLAGFTNRDGTPASTIYYAITNQSGSASTVQVAFARLALEG